MELSGDMVGETATLLCLYGIINRYKNSLFGYIWQEYHGVCNKYLTKEIYDGAL